MFFPSCSELGCLIKPTAANAAWGKKLNTYRKDESMEIKICGLTEKKEGDYLNKYGADYAGFVLFYPKSKRNIDITQAKEIMDTLNSSIKRVAVTVSPDEEQLSQIADAGFDYIQVHGKLPQNMIFSCSLPILRAFNVTDMENFEIYRHNPQIAGYVFDALEPGSGVSFDWNLLKQIPRDGKRLFLAGGLDAGNVSQAIRAVKPEGVDVSSGVEFDNRNGKDPDKIQAFIAAVRNTGY